MTKLCPRGKAAAKRKFKVYPSAYANAYASKICAGKIKDPSGTKRKDFRGPKPSIAMGGRIYKAEGGPLGQPGTLGRTEQNRKRNKDLMRSAIEGDSKKFKKFRNPEKAKKFYREKAEKSGIAMPKRLMRESKPRRQLARPNMMGGGMMKMPRAMYKKGGIAKGCGAVMNDRRKVTKVF